MEAVSIARGVTVGNGTARGSGCTDRGSGRGESAVGVGVGVGVLAVDGVGAGVFTARGLISIPLRVSAGPCACGVALGVEGRRVTRLRRGDVLVAHGLVGTDRGSRMLT